MEDLLFERGIEICHASVGLRGNQLGPRLGQVARSLGLKDGRVWLYGALSEAGEGQSHTTLAARP